MPFALTKYSIFVYSFRKMLTSKEKKETAKLLKNVDDEDLMSLVQTVTKSQIRVTTRQEAIQAIVTFSECATELLKRQKIRRDYLFQYLSQEGIYLSPNSEKHVLRDRILQLWKCEEQQGQHTHDTQAQAVHVEEHHEQGVNIGVQIHQDVGITKAVTVAAGGSAVATQATTLKENNNVGNYNEAGELALQFAGWFYQILNAYHPDSREAPVESFGSQHFFRDCKLKLLSATPDLRKEMFDGADVVCRRLLAFVKEENLKFNPNLSKGGVKGFSEPHGLNVITACGTVHHGGNLVGIFEQQFGLARDPDMEQNWRVKFTNLKVRSGSVAETPTLEATASLLAIQS